MTASSNDCETPRLCVCGVVRSERARVACVVSCTLPRLQPCLPKSSSTQSYSAKERSSSIYSASFLPSSRPTFEPSLFSHNDTSPFQDDITASVRPAAPPPITLDPAVPTNSAEYAQRKGEG